MLAHPHRQVEQPRQRLGELRQFVEMRGEQRARAVDVVEMLDAGVGDREAVEGRRAAADLVEDDERALGRLVEDRRRLDHLDHEGRAAAREIVGRADAREQPVDDADMRAPRRHVGAHLRERRDQRVLPQIGRFARHVRAGDERDAPALARRRRKDRNHWRRTARRARAAPPRRRDGGRPRSRSSANRRRAAASSRA